MNPLVLWLGLTVMGGAVYLFFRARWWLYLMIIGVDMLFMAALGLDKTTQFITGGLLVLGFVALDLFFLRKSQNSQRSEQ